MIEGFNLVWGGGTSTRGVVCSVEVDSFEELIT
jgi:hypothetical protein